MQVWENVDSQLFGRFIRKLLFSFENIPGAHSSNISFSARKKISCNVGKKEENKAVPLRGKAEASELHCADLGKRGFSAFWQISSKIMFFF